MFFSSDCRIDFSSAKIALSPTRGLGNWIETHDHVVRKNGKRMNKCELMCVVKVASKIGVGLLGCEC